MSGITQNQINQSLQRNIVSGDQYEQYYTPSTCSENQLGKGTTTHGMKKIAAWAKKHKHESTAIAKAEFAGYSLAETTKRIHQFLFHHFQYEIDRELQRLKAPNCMWASRAQGNDCKSFSLNASTILLNLGIRHYLRRTKQAAYYPSLYTHVYVVVPKDQKHGSLRNGYYTIDGTIQSMVELPYLKKDDTYMEEANLQYVGLSAPSCGCTNQTNYPNNTDIVGLSAAYKGQSVTQFSKSDYHKVIYESLNRVDDFLNVLAPYTTSEHSSNLLRGKIFDKLWNGHNPTLKFTPKGIYVDGEFVNFSKTFARLKKSNPSFGMGANPSTGVPTADFLISSVLGDNFFADTFGAIFANGLELTCWGSTFTPQQTSAQIQAIQAPYFEDLFQGLQAATTVGILGERLNFLAMAVFVCRDMYWFLRVNENWRRCSRLALDQYNELFYALVPAFESIVSSLGLTYNITEIRQETTAAAWVFEGYNHEWSENTTAVYPVFNVTSRTSTNPTQPTNPSTPPVITDGSGVPNLPEKKKSSTGLLLTATAVIGTLIAKA
ncbi:hypothetical protein H2O64_04785 [Kordia sp. YSTF-M3]|uniref:Phage portal protein n=1 Tax=Kordia aestuariivivens TaxID=2759037 RepID=A0ABR7Q605_9FLAO|nr:hypothetical protein [Kordia aestuariivivens]MBC8753975.1 hypothetical protein [Kordia aestuariivivens]